MARHTPGPWRSVRRSATIAVEDSRGEILGEVYGKTTRPETEWHANAALISAAPELFDVLIDLVEKAEQVDEELTGPADREYFPPSLLTKARAAIAKATGEPG